MNTTAVRERDGERESTTTMASASLLTIQLPNPTYPIRASSAATTTQSPLPSVLDQKFGRKGIKFTESRGGALGVELTVRNGSSLRLSVPDGLVTSYKPKVYWRDDGFEEIVHTVGEGRNVKGGIGLVMNEVSEVIRTGGGSPWSASEWEVKDADSDSIDAVQVELSCTNGNGALEITCIISLYAVSMAMAVVVKNEGKKQVTLTSAMMSHLKFKSRYGSAIQGLKGCSYCSHPPISSKFGIVSPSEAMKPEDPGWPLFSFNNGKNEKQGEWYKEEDKFTILRNKLSRLYAVPPEDRLKRIYNTLPSNYKTIDQGNGLGFRVIRMGYDDIYIGSPGSSSQKYSNDHFICTGPASMLVPVVLNPGEEWRGAQVIEHDNL